MSNLTRNTIDIEEQLRRIEGMEKRSGSLPPFSTFEFTGNGATVAYAMAKGWKPLAVYDAGSRQTEGSGDDWTMAFDGYVWIVTFAVAPTNLNVILVDAWRAE